MVDRQDIDALLVGALYGELTPADEARLASHLESHPGDRAALDDLKTARQAVRESRIFELQHEPPQAVSALLLQEAHRRAPKAARARSQHERDGEGWFARLARSFFAHPAMAAAAMLVVVVGVAGTLYLKKGGDEFANKEITAGAPAAPAATPTTAAAPPTGAAAAGSGYDVGLAEDNAALDRRAGAPADPAKEAGLERGKDEVARTETDKADKADDYKVGRFASKDGVADGDRRKQAPPTHGTGKPAVAVNTPSPELQPKDLDLAKTRAPKGALSYESQQGAAAGGGAAAQRDDKTVAAMADSAAPGGAPAQAAPAPAPPPPPQAVKAPARSSLANNGASGPTGNAPAAKNSVANNHVAPADPQASWAQDALTKAIAFAKNDNCKDAANVALEIRNKAPAFYNANVADNRALKGCAPYMRNNVDQAEQRSKKNAPSKVDNESVK